MTLKASSFTPEDNDPRPVLGRVCMLVFAYYPQDPRVLREATALRRAGYDIDVFCLRQNHEARREDQAGVQVFRIQVGPLQKESLVRYLYHTLVFALLALARISQVARRRGYALYQVHNMPDFLVFSCAVGRLLGKPILLDLHDLSVELFESKLSGRRQALLRPLVVWQERLACRFADHLITTSEGFRRQLIARGHPESKITLVLNSADLLLFSYDETRRFEPLGDELRLLYHGTVARRFGLHEVIQALHHLRSRYPRVSLDVFGKYDPAYQLQLRALIEQLNLQDQVRLGNWRTPRELREIIRAAHIAVVPYLQDAFMDIAISTKTFEYAASGLPVVASRLHAMTDIYAEDSVTYVEPGDSAALATAILALAGDPARRARQSRLAYADQRQVSGAVMAERYTALITSLVSREPPSPQSAPALGGEEVSR